MSSETVNHDLLIATEKTPHIAITDGPTDIILDPSGKPVPGTNWDDMKKLRKVGGYGSFANTQNTFIDGAVVFLRSGRIDAATKSDHPVVGVGQKSGFFRGDIDGLQGSPDLVKEFRPVMRTTDPTRHNGFPPTGGFNALGHLKVNLSMADLEKQLIGQLRKLCEITKYDGKCSHGRAVPSGEQLEVVKSGNPQRPDGQKDSERRADESTEWLEFEVLRQDTSVVPAKGAKCQQPGQHTHWKAMYGREILKEQKGVDKFRVNVPGVSTPALTGIIPAIKWMLDTISGPGILTVTATSCASSRTSVVRCYPNGKINVNFTQEIETFRKRMEKITRVLNFVVAMGRLLNGGKLGDNPMIFKILPGNNEISFECEFKERDNHLVGAEWKLTFACNPLAYLKIEWPIPLHIFLGPLGIIARGAQWLAEAAGIRGDLIFALTVQLVVAGVVERSKDGKFGPGFDAAIEIIPAFELTLSKGGTREDPTYKLTIVLSLNCSVKLKVRPNDKGQGAVKGTVVGEIQGGLSIEYQKKGNSPKKLIDAKPEWAKWPKTDESQKIGDDFIIC